VLRYFAARTAGALAVLAAITLFVAYGIRLTGDPAAALFEGAGAPSAEDIARIQRALGTNRPFIEQYASFVAHAVRGDLGTSFRTSQPVLTLIGERLPATLALAAGGMEPVSSSHVTWALSLAFPFRPVEHDGRLSVQFGIPSGGQEVGASTPLQAVHVPPLALQPPVRTQTANPVKPETVHALPRVPTTVMSPLGAFTVTLHGADADGCVMLPSSHDESVNGPPPELLTEKLKVV